MHAHFRGSVRLQGRLSPGHDNSCGREAVLENDDGVAWFSAIEAQEFLEGHFGGSTKAKRRIADLLWEGRLKARAREIWKSETEKLGTALRIPPAESRIRRNVTIERQIWRSTKRWKGDQFRWRWLEGDFFITSRKEPKRRYILKGVEFAAADIEKILTLGKKSSKPQKASGPPVRAEAWTAFWHGLIDLAQSGRLTRDQFSTQKELRFELLTHYMAEGEDSEGLADRTLKTPVRQVYRKFIGNGH